MKTSLQKVLEALKKPEEWADLLKEDRVDPEDAWKKALKISREVSNRKVIRRLSKIQWNGKVLHALNPSDLLHDVAHFQVATADRRFKPDYGLGMGPDTTLGVPVLIPRKERETEEIVASLLGILWGAQLGFPFRFTLRNHNWDHDTEYQPALQQLQRYALVIKGEPVAALRT